METQRTTVPKDLRAVVIDWTGARSEGKITTLGTDRVFLRFATEKAPVLGLGETVQLEFSNLKSDRSLAAKSVAIGRVELDGLRQYEFKFVDPEELWLRHDSELPDIFFLQRGAAIPHDVIIPVLITTEDGAVSLRGQLRDISSEGMAVIVRGNSVEPLATVDHVHLSFELTSDRDPISIFGVIRKRRLSTGGHRYSLEFDPQRSKDLTESCNRIDRWITLEQRRTLRAHAASGRRPSRTIQSKVFAAMWLVTLLFILAVVLANLPVQGGSASDGDAAPGLWLWVVGAGVAASVVSFLVSRGIARSLSSPMQDLTRVSCEFAEGNLDAPVPEPMTKEMAVLSGSFTRMAERIQLLMIDAHQQAQVVEQQWAELKLSTAKEDFLVLVSHELRTPLTSIISFTDILLTCGKNEAPHVREEFLRVIRQQSDRLNGLISQLLDLARIQAGTLSWNVSELDLADIVRRGAEAVLDPRDGSHGRVQTDVPHHHCRYKGDAERLQHVVSNLVDNGRKFSPEGETISISLKCVDGGYEIWVSDRGRGVRNEDKERIFEKFVQVGDVMTDRPQGSGLGLSVSHETVKAHGGKIACRDNDSGQGAVFVVFLPIPDPDSPRLVDEGYRRNWAKQSKAIAVP